MQKDKNRKGEAKMYCPKCGKENENDSKFCDKCGANLQEEQVVQKAEKTSPQKQSKLKLVIPIVLVVCVGLAVLLFGSGDKYVKIWTSCRAIFLLLILV